MGQKISPRGLRLGINQTWDSRWYANKKDFARLLSEDIQMREHIMKQLPQAGISRVVFERPAARKVTITIHTARPGVIIGKKGADIEKLKKSLAKIVDSEIHLNIMEVRKPELDARLVAKSIAEQMQRRVGYKRAMKRAIQSAMRLGAEGIRIRCSGRLGGIEIARKEEYREGRVPLHTLRADVDYGTAEALTTYGINGVKVWIYRGDIMEHNPMAQERRQNDQQSQR